MTADCEALACNGLAVADALHQAVTDDRVLVLACGRHEPGHARPEEGGGGRGRRGPLAAIAAEVEHSTPHSSLPRCCCIHYARLAIAAFCSLEAFGHTVIE